MSTCLAAGGASGNGGELMQFPAEPTLGIVLGIVCLGVRAGLKWLVSRKPGPEVKRPFFGAPQAAVLSQVFGLFFAFNTPTAVLFFIFRSQPGYNSQEFACFLQNGSQLGPGSYITIIIVAWLLYILSMMNRRVAVRHEVVRRFSELGYLRGGRTDAVTIDVDVPQPSSTPAASAAAGRPRIAFVPTHAGCWVYPFVKAFADSCGGDFDVVCFDNYGHPKLCDLKDDQWLRCNLALEDSDGLFAEKTGRATLKVVLTDYFTLDVPSNSIDVVVIPTGASMMVLALDCKTDEEKEERLSQLLTEVNRVLRPGGRLLSSSLFISYKLWDKAVARSGLAVPVQPDEVEPDYVKYLPFVLRKIFKAMRPDPADPEGHGTGRKGWLPKAVWWTALPARLHLAVGTSSTTAASVVAVKGEDFIPSPSPSNAAADETIPTNKPIVFQSSVADAEEQDFFPPGRQFRLAEALTAFNTLCWVALVLVAWRFMADMQVPTIMPYSRQVSAFVMEVVLLMPPVIIFNADALREAGKTKGLVVPAAVLRNKVLRSWATQRVYFLGVVLFSLLLWAPYLVLDYCLIVYGGKTQEEAQQYNFAIAIAISLFFILGGKRVGAYLARRSRTAVAEEEAAEAEDIKRESQVSYELGGGRGGGGGTKGTAAAVANPIVAVPPRL